MVIDWSKAGTESGLVLEERQEDGSTVYINDLRSNISVICGRGAFEDYVQVSEPNEYRRTGCFTRRLNEDFGWDLTKGKQYIATKQIQNQKDAAAALTNIGNVLEQLVLS